MAFGKQFRPVTSEAVEWFSFDDLTCTLWVAFQPSVNHVSGGVYDYLDVPSSVIGKLVASPSFGGFINKTIKKHYQVRLVASPVPRMIDSSND